MNDGGTAVFVDPWEPCRIQRYDHQKKKVREMKEGGGWGWGGPGDEKIGGEAFFLWCAGRGPEYGSCPSLCVCTCVCMCVHVCDRERERESVGGGKGSGCTPLSPLQPHTDTFTQSYMQQQ